MAPKSSFVLKDSPEVIKEAAKEKNVQPKGRTYSTAHALKPGGIKVDDLVLGMKLASLAITDDKPNTLRSISKANPWQKEALKLITNGTKQEAYLPLSDILQKYFDLTVDCHIDVTGIHRGRPLDTQGYIAHNDEMIVLAYRCTTSALDWITNLSTTSSEWEPEVDIELGHAGYCSCLMGHDLNFCGNSDTPVKPRVHTGFYNNFLHTTPLILKNIKPLLEDKSKPRRLYVCGHSLGAGIATLAACYFLLNYDWELLPHSLVCVTAGSPRCCQKSMADVVHARLRELQPLNKAFFCRIVLNEDVVTKVPPSFLGYVHLDSLVYITQEGEVLIRPNEGGNLKIDVDDQELQQLTTSNEKGTNAYQDEKKLADEEDSDDNSDASSRQANEKYERKLKLIPTALKDHMPDFYLKPLVKLFEREKNGESITTIS